MSQYVEYEPQAFSYHQLHLWALQMHVMLGAGVPLHGGLELIAMSEMPRLSEASALLAETIGQGRRLSEAMKVLDPTFGPFVINLVAVGERSGRLGEVFERLSERAFRRDRTDRAVKGALAYPFFLGALCLAMVFFMAFYMFPKLLPFLTGLGIALPWPTRVLIWGSEHLTTFLLVGTVLAAWGGHLVATKTRVREWLLFSSPVFGKINRERVYADTLNDLYLMLESNCDILASLKSLNPPWSALREQVLDCAEKLRSGLNVAQAMDQSGMLPHRYLAPVSTAEETGQLPRALRMLSEQLEENVTLQVDRLVQLLEPAIMAGMGLVTGFVVLATFLPLYSMASSAL